MCLEDSDSNVFIFNRDDQVIDIERFARIQNISRYLVTANTFKESSEIYDPPSYSKDELPLVKIKSILGIDTFVTSTSKCITVKKIKNLHSLQISLLKSVFQDKKIKFIVATNCDIQISLFHKKYRHDQT